MSSTYNLEPTPTAKVILHTTLGDLELELFAKQTPITSRNFLQLCLDGYYDNTVFHRLVKGFILQGGDPTGTGQGGESSYNGDPFADEFNSRLQYTRRGLLGMANTGKDDNGSQFFFTLAKAPELQGKNTLFGRVAGDTIFNLMKMADVELADGSDERPMFPTRITGAEVIINPFKDMVKRNQIQQPTEAEAKKPKKPKRKAGKALLSFGGDEGDDGEVMPVPKKAKYNAKLVSAGEKMPIAEEDSPISKEHKHERAIPIRKPARKSPSPVASPPPKTTAAAAAQPLQRNEPPPPRQREPSPKTEKQSKLDRVNEQIAELKASMKRTTTTQRDEPTKKKSLLESMVPANTTRGRKRGAGANNTASEQATLDILHKFKSKLEAAPADSRMKSPSATSGANDTANSATLPQQGADEEEVPCDLHFVVGCQSCTAWDKQAEEESDDDTGWMSHSLSFAKDRLGKDLEWKRKNEEELVVIDPLEKAKELKAENRRGKGKTGRDWDNDKGKKKMKL